MLIRLMPCLQGRAYQELLLMSAIAARVGGNLDELFNDFIG
jgi:hypothetical protein